MTARYLLCPGPVRSRIDGDIHHLGARHLAQLYGVRMGECIALPQGPGLDQHLRRDALLARTDLIRLSPRGDGDYHLPS